MEKSVPPGVTVFGFKGRLVYVAKTKSETTIELESLKYQDQIDFISELRSTAKLTSKFQWQIEDVQNVINDRNGLEEPCILASCYHGKAGVKRFCVIQAKWRGSSFFNHSSKPGGKCIVELIPFVEFSHTGQVCKSLFCSLTYGPRVILVSQNRLLLFTAEESQGKNVSKKHEFAVCDLVQSEVSDICGSGSESFGNQISSNILAVISEQQWIVSLLFIGRQHYSSLVAIALERNAETDDFKRNILRQGDFVPQEYVPKISAIFIQHCKQTVSESDMCTYENVCAVGFNDGYVMVFFNGIMQNCVTLWTFTDVPHQGFNVTKLISFSKDLLICCTDSRYCYVLNRPANKVVHHWDAVDQAVIGDFLQSGGKQLLLLFDSGCPEQPHSSFLLTDLQGFVVDRRQASTDSSLSLIEDESFQEDCTARNLQPLVDALQEQNETLARKVAEEEQRLASKQLFVAETWRRLVNLSLHGPKGIPDISQPEVPLVPLLGGDKPRSSGRMKLKMLDQLENIKIKTVWHHIIDDKCVVGVKIHNMSNRNLHNCCIVLTTQSDHESAPPQQCSVLTRIWQTFCRDSVPPAVIPNPSQGSSLQKRQKVNLQLQVHPVQVIQPSELVTVTGTFAVPDLGFIGEMEQLVHLIYSVEGRKEISSCDTGSDISAPKGNSSSEGHLKSGFAGVRSGSGERPDADSLRFKCASERDQRKCVTCGKVVWKASDLLQQKGQELSCMRTDLEYCQPTEPDQPRFEEELLALSSVQQGWICDISFVLHQVTEVAHCLQRAGFVFHGQLGQYVTSPASPQCLHYVRIKQLGFRPLPQRTAGILVFVRKPNQLLLVLRHLYSYLPQDASISLASEQQTSDLQHLASVISAQLCETKRQARAVLETHGVCLRGKDNSAEQSDKQTPHPDKTKDGKFGSDHVSCEREEFCSQQTMYRQSQVLLIRKEDVVKFEAGIEDCKVDTDVAVAKFKL